MAAPVRDSIEITPSASPTNAPFHPHQTPPGIGSTPSSISPPAPRATSICMHLKNMTRCVFSQIGRVLIFILRPFSWIKNRICPEGPPSSQLHMHNQIHDHPSHPILVEGEVSSFFSLPITDNDRANIRYIITTLANTNCVALAWYASSLKSKGGQIDHLHPLKFLEYILQHPELVRNLKTMQGSVVTKLQWDGFLSGSIGKLDRNAASLPSYYPGFAHSLRVNPSDLDPYIRDRKWEDMIRFLIDVKLGLIEVDYIAPVLAELPTAIRLPPPEILALSEAEAATVLGLLKKYAQLNILTTPVSELIGDLNRLWTELENTEILPLLNHVFSVPTELFTTMDLDRCERFKAGLNRWIVQQFAKESFPISTASSNQIITLADEKEWDALSTLLTQHRRSLE